MSKQHDQSSSSSKPNSTLFKIPIFPPLLVSYDVPAPIIIPPGSDPCLLNPNPYDDQVLETRPSLIDMDIDIDPCVVASRSDSFITKRVDLTADEHAGVSLSLSEPETMVSTACELSLNSEAVAPQTVNYVNCNSEKSFKKHIEENIHLNNTKKLTGSSTINQESKKKKNQDLENINRIVSTVIEQETPLAVANSTLDELLEKKKQDLSQKEAAGKSLLACEYPKSLFVCDIPEPGREYPKIATVEVDESMFKSPTTVEPSNSGTKNRPTKLSVHQCNWCDICKVRCHGDKDFDKHIAGKQHQKNLKVSEKTPTPPLTTFVTARDTTPITKSMEESKLVIGNGKTTRCEICKVSFGTNLYDMHVSGRKHTMNLLKLKKIPDSPSTVANSNEGNSSSCELCGVYCTSNDMLNKHISGKKHQKNLKKNEQQLVSSPAPAPKTQLPKPMKKEGEIVFLEGSKRKANDSLSSEEDADTKRQKMNEEEEACRVLVICKVCNVGFDGLMAFKTHIASFEHSAMLLKQSKG